MGLLPLCALAFRQEVKAGQVLRSCSRFEWTEKKTGASTAKLRDERQLSLFVLLSTPQLVWSCYDFGFFWAVIFAPSPTAVCTPAGNLLRFLFP